MPRWPALDLWWQRATNGFLLVETRQQDGVLVFRCTHFDVVTRRCDSYHSRPGMCRDYHRLLLHAAHPVFMDGCGHRSVLQAGHKLLRILDEQGLTAEQREQLRRKLNLD